LKAPVSVEVDALRRALGDKALGRIVPHITLVPPVNVRAEQLSGAEDVVRSAAAQLDGPLELSLGPPATFWPASPVLYLPVGGSAADLAALARLHDAVLTGPLHKLAPWPWVPHVTLADNVDPGRIDAAVASLAGYRAEVVLDRAVLLEERERTWVELADTGLGPPSVVGRGGLALEISQGCLLSPQGLSFVQGLCTPEDLTALSQAGRGAGDGGQKGARPIVLGGRREGQLVGMAMAWVPATGEGAGGQGPVSVTVLVSADSRRQGVGRALLAALQAAAARRGWAATTARAYGPPAFFSECGAWARAGRPDL
jgi:2'-5' RNA ligase/GNAT superfamily N-acetyltransferase